MEKRIVSLSLTILIILTSYMTAVASTLQEQNQAASSTRDPCFSLSLATSPTADAGGPYTGKTYIAVAFDGSHSFDADGSIVSYIWHCGDGSVVTGIKPTHTYKTPGIYTLTLTVKDNEENCGTDSTTVTITIDDPPIIEFISPLDNYLYIRNNQLFALPTPTIIIGPCDLTVDAQDDVAIRRVEFYVDDVLKHVAYSEPYSMKWNTGLLKHTITAIAYDSSGQQSSAESTVFKWRLHPIFIISMLLLLRKSDSLDIGTWFIDKQTNQHILLSLLRYFLASSQDNDGIITDIIEKLLQQDQNTINIIDFLNDHPLLKKRLRQQFPFLYSILLVTNIFNNLDDSLVYEKHRLIKTILLLAMLPTISSVDDQKTLDGSRLIDTAKWMRQHRFLVLASSLLLITLISRLTNKEPVDTTPDIVSENKAPHANAGGPYEGSRGSPVQFSAEKSYDEDGVIVKFEWDFGDGSKATGKTVTHIYTNVGVYSVTLTVTDDGGKRTTNTTIVSITDLESTGTPRDQDANPFFWVISGSLSGILLLGLAVVTFRRRLFE
jgi:PKD repeat protein